MDYRPKAVDMLEHIAERRTAMSLCKDRIAELDGRMGKIKGTLKTADPVKGTGENSMEDMWLCLIAEKADEERRLRIVCKSVREFNKAWSALTEDEKNVLNEFYIIGGKSAVDRLVQQYKCDPKTVYRKRDDALI